MVLSSSYDVFFFFFFEQELLFEATFSGSFGDYKVKYKSWNKIETQSIFIVCPCVVDGNSISATWATDYLNIFIFPGHGAHNACFRIRKSGFCCFVYVGIHPSLPQTFIKTETSQAACVHYKKDTVLYSILIMLSILYKEPFIPNREMKVTLLNVIAPYKMGRVPLWVVIVL